MNITPLDIVVIVAIVIVVVTIFGWLGRRP